MAAEDVQDLSPLAKDFGFFTPIKHFGLETMKDGRIRVDVVGAGKTLETTECSAEFLKAILIGYGYAITRAELHPGTIRLLAAETGRS
jgi:hypothetical protein